MCVGFSLKKSPYLTWVLHFSNMGYPWFEQFPDKDFKQNLKEFTENKIGKHVILKYHMIVLQSND